MSDTEKDLTYEEAKELCKKAFDGGVTYGTECMRYGVNAVAYDWEHWLKKNERWFMPTPTVEDVLREFVAEFSRDDSELCDEEIIERFAEKLRLAGDE